MKPKLTIGMAVYDDPHAVDTIMDIRMDNAEIADQLELVVVDNAPNTRVGRDLKQRMKHWFHKGLASCNYAELPEPVGTCPPVQRIFEVANGEAVLVMDAHVRLYPGTLANLIQFYADNPDCFDLLGGPLVLDDLETRHTHLDDIWGGTMRGRWGEAWQRDDGEVVSVILTDGARCGYAEMKLGSAKVDGPNVRHPDRKVELTKLGWRQLGFDDSDDFDIPAHGAGLFTCRRLAWPGLNPQFRGFGGAQFYLHEKFRRNGRRVRCLGFLKWWHLFGYVNGTPYQATTTDIVRNELIGNAELGWSSNKVREAFVDAKKLPPEVFDQIAENPIAYPASKPRGLSVPEGMGTELLAITKEMGMPDRPGCGCKRFAQLMNQWGIEGCRTNREQILTTLRKHAKAWGWGVLVDAAQLETDEAALSDEVVAVLEPVEGETVEPMTATEKAYAAYRAVVSGLAFKLDPRDPFPGMVDEAKRRFEAKSQSANISGRATSAPQLAQR